MIQAFAKTRQMVSSRSAATLLLVFALVNLSLWRMKRTAATPSGIIDVPVWVPAAGCITSTLFVAVQALLDLFGQA